MAIRFNVDEPMTLSFPYGDFQEIESSYPNDDGSPKMQYKYTVEDNGTRDTLFATASLHKKLQAAGMGAEATMVVVKVRGPPRHSRGKKEVAPHPSSPCRCPPAA